jgi:hypothetical protein
MKKYLLPLILFLLSFARARAHEDTSLSSIYTSTVKNLRYLDQNMHVFVDTNSNTDLQVLRGIMFLHLNELPNRRVMKRYMIDSKVYLLFWIRNDEEKPRDFFITPGIYAKECLPYPPVWKCRYWYVASMPAQTLFYLNRT